MCMIVKMREMTRIDDGWGLRHGRVPRYFLLYDNLHVKLLLLILNYESPKKIMSNPRG